MYNYIIVVQILKLMHLNVHHDDTHTFCAALVLKCGATYLVQITKCDYPECVRVKCLCPSAYVRMYICVVKNTHVCVLPLENLHENTLCSFFTDLFSLQLLNLPMKIDVFCAAHAANPWLSNHN